MKYTFEDNHKMGFFCKTCLNTTLLNFGFTASGDNNNSNVPLRIQPNYNKIRVNCGRCGSKMVAIDPPLLKFIQFFNEKGYLTKYCCSGHIVRESPIINISGVRYKPDSDFNEYPALTLENIREYGKSKLRGEQILISDIKGLPREIEYLDEPELIFHYKMPIPKKQKLWDAINQVLNNKNEDEKKYPDFQGVCYSVYPNGNEYNEECEPNKRTVQDINYNKEDRQNI